MDVSKELLHFIFREREARYTQLTAFVRSNDICSEKTMLKYKNQLEDQGKIKKKISKKTKRPVYYLTAETRDEIASELEWGIEQVLSSFDATKIIYAMLLGKRMSKNVAEYLDEKPSVVEEQMKKLLKINLVYRADPEAFEVNWYGLLDFFLKCAPRSLGTRIRMKRKLLGTRNRYLKKTIEGYLRWLFEHPVRNITITDAFKAFEDGLLRVFPELRQKAEEKEKQDFLSALGEWHNNASDTFTFTQKALRESLEKAGLLK